MHYFGTLMTIEHFVSSIDLVFMVPGVFERFERAEITVQRVVFVSPRRSDPENFSQIEDQKFLFEKNRVSKKNELKKT